MRQLRITKMLLSFMVMIFLTLHLKSQELDSIVKAPEFQLADLSGNTVSLKDFEGQYLLIHIATTWCPYCNAEAPYLEELVREYESANVGVLIIDVKEPRELIATRLRDRFQLTFPILMDSEGIVAAAFAPANVLPELARDEIMLASNILIDPEGNIRYMSLLDTRNFDSKLIHIKEILNELLESN